jgi:hypothetical protein
MSSRSCPNPDLAMSALKLAILMVPLVAAPIACSGVSAANGDGTVTPLPTATPSAPTATTQEPPVVSTAPKVPSARVAAVEPSRDGGLYLRAKILFKNPTTSPCRFMSYRLTWGASSKEIKLDSSLVIPPGENRERWLKVHPEDGDLSDLTEIKSLVQVQTECGL